MVTLELTDVQLNALIELVEDARITGRDAPLVTGILTSLARAGARAVERADAMRDNADAGMFDAMKPPEPEAG